jgi:hypothetical protein
MFKWLDKIWRRKWLEMTFGELVDKIAIIQVKIDRLPVGDPRIETLKEQYLYLVDSLGDYAELILTPDQKIRLSCLLRDLYYNAYAQWDFEDAMSRIGDDVPIPDRLEAMKGSYYHNRKRALLKKEVDEMFNEKYKEVKQYSGMTQNEGKYKL